MSNKLKFLGTDSGHGLKNTAAWMVSEDNRLILIDCGATVFTTLLERGILERNWSGIDVIITHLHPDHAGTVSQLGLWTYFERSMPINVITKCKNIDTFLSITDLDQNLSMPGYPEVRYTREDKYGILFIPTVHSIGIDSYGFVLFPSEDPKDSFVYTGDTASLDNFLPFLGKDKATTLYMDASVNGGVHLKLEDNMNLLRQLIDEGIEIYLMHMDNVAKIREITEGTGIKLACDLDNL